MKSTIFTIALVFSLGTTAFSQETEAIVLPTTTDGVNNVITLSPLSGEASSMSATKKEFKGHVTLLKREVKPSDSEPVKESEEIDRQRSNAKHKKTGHVTLLK